jgi:hypothetical protein
VKVRLRVLLPGNEAMAPTAPDGTPVRPGSVEHRAWGNILELVRPIVAAYLAREDARAFSGEVLGINAEFRYAGAPAGELLEEERVSLSETLTQRLQDYLANPAPPELTLVSYDKPEIGRCRVDAQLLRPGLDASLTHSDSSAIARPMSEIKIQPRLMTPEEEATLGPQMDLEKLSAFNRSSFDPAELAPYIGKWIAWKPDSSGVVAAAEDIPTLNELVAARGEDPGRCPIEFLDEE